MEKTIQEHTEALRKFIFKALTIADNEVYLRCKLNRDIDYFPEKGNTYEIIPGLQTIKDGIDPMCWACKEPDCFDFCPMEDLE